MTSAPGGARPAATPPPTAGDATGLVPAGYGTLRQDDIALHVQQFGLQVRVVPLEESVIRLLSPDSYRSLRDLRESKRAQLAAMAQRTASRTLSLWYVSFFGTEQGATRFSPMEMIITNVGRDFRPLDVLPLTAGFGEQRVAQRETQSAIFVFDGQLEVNQPLTLVYQGTSSAEWQDVLPRLERERTLVRSRAARQ